MVKKHSFLLIYLPAHLLFACESAEFKGSSKISHTAQPTPVEQKEEIDLEKKEEAPSADVDAAVGKPYNEGFYCIYNEEVTTWRACLATLPAKCDSEKFEAAAAKPAVELATPESLLNLSDGHYYLSRDITIPVDFPRPHVEYSIVERRGFKVLRTTEQEYQKMGFDYLGYESYGERCSVIGR